MLEPLGHKQEDFTSSPFQRFQGKRNLSLPQKVFQFVLPHLIAEVPLCPVLKCD